MSGLGNRHAIRSTAERAPISRKLGEVRRRLKTTWQATGGRNIKLKAPFGEITLTFNETFTEYHLTAGDKGTMSQGVKGKKK